LGYADGKLVNGLGLFVGGNGYTGYYFGNFAYVFNDFVEGLGRLAGVSRAFLHP
jgi:hypothetical protein